jgi:hypothetical protein
MSQDTTKKKFFSLPAKYTRKKISTQKKANERLCGCCGTRFREYLNDGNRMKFLAVNFSTLQYGACSLWSRSKLVGWQIEIMFLMRSAQPEFDNFSFSVFGPTAFVMQWSLRVTRPAECLHAKRSFRPDLELLIPGNFRYSPRVRRAIELAELEVYQTMPRKDLSTVFIVDRGRLDFRTRVLWPRKSSSSLDHILFIAKWIETGYGRSFDGSFA